VKETVLNLAKAFIGESQARNRYTFYASIARKEGFEQIADIFQMTADNEREHASWAMKLINQLKDKDKSIDTLTVEAPVPTTRGTTEENIKSAIAGETYEYKEMYPGFADVAEKEGLRDIATRLRHIALAEKHHAERYTKLLKEVAGGTVFKKPKEVWWVCRECGYLHFGKTPPVKCPSCDHPRAFYQVKCEEY